MTSNPPAASRREKISLGNEHLQVNGRLVSQTSRSQAVESGLGAVAQLVSNTTAVVLPSAAGTITTFALVGLGTSSFNVSGDSLHDDSVLVITPRNDADAASVISVVVESVPTGAAGVRRVSVTATTAATDAPVVLNYRVL